MCAAPALSHLVYFSERGAGPPLLLIHGLMVSGEMFDPVLDHFAAHHRVIVPDLRGHGRSRGLPPPYTTARLAADLADLLDHLGIASATVLGYSQGGAIAQQLALDHPKQCSRLVLACTFAYNMATTSEWIEGQLTPALINLLGLKRVAHLAGSQAMDQLSKEQAEWLAGLIAGQDKKLMVKAWRETMRFDSRPRLAEIRCPVLVIAGEKDKGVPIHHARMLHAGIPGSQLVIIPGADHALLFTHPVEFLQAVDRFLEA